MSLHICTPVEVRGGRLIEGRVGLNLGKQRPVLPMAWSWENVCPLCCRSKYWAICVEMKFLHMKSVCQRDSKKKPTRLSLKRQRQQWRHQRWKLLKMMILFWPWMMTWIPAYFVDEFFWIAQTASHRMVFPAKDRGFCTTWSNGWSQGRVGPWFSLRTAASSLVPWIITFTYENTSACLQSFQPKCVWFRDFQTYNKKVNKDVRLLWMPWSNHMR